jgi:ClpX C4-type zinc finger protein
MDADMATDPALLQQARTAGANLAEAERQVLLSRAEYHTAIRRLHLAGGSFREIAEALSLSHQRVQQIVSAAGGSWWQVWRSRRVKRDAVCTWCERPPSEVAKLIAGPNVFICDACVAVAERQLEAAPRRPSAGATRRCSFCSRSARQTRSLAYGKSSICNECLRVCREILDTSNVTQER